MKKHLILSLIAVAAALVACKKNNEPTNPEITPTGESVELFRSGIKATAEAKDVALTFTSAIAWSAQSNANWIVLSPASGNGGNVTLTVSVAKNESLEARYGNVTITSGTVSKKITVNQDARERIPVTGIVLDKSSASLKAGETVTIKATVIPSNTDDDKTITWSTSNASVATVEAGVVTAVYEGTATITAAIGSVKATCEITVEHTVVPVESISLNKTTLTLKETQTETLIATVLPANADDKTVTWTASDESVATVVDGLVTAIHEGAATITASAAGFSATCEVTVEHLVIEVESITLDKTSATLYENETVTLTATVNPANADDKTVTWASSDEAVATVADGVVTALVPGTATITATAGTKQATCVITVEHLVIEVESITLDKTEISIYEGETTTITATVLPANADDKTVTWASSDETVVTVVGGVVTAIHEGTATITASAGSKQATCAVTVLHTAVEVESVSLDITQAELYEGQTLTLTATVLPANADNKTVTWTSSDETVATVAGGVVTAVAPGTATITATTGNNKTATCALTVYKRGSTGEDLGDPIVVNPWE